MFKNALSNHEVLTRLGLKKLHIPASHSRKRLAVESRHHNEDDSKMYFVKLPPNPYYYAHTKPDKNALANMSKKLAVGFKSNGKPGRIYHWNIPVLKKIAGLQKHHSRSQLSRHDDSDIFDIQKTPTWNTFTYQNDAGEKPYLKPLKHVKKTPTYYVPVKPKKGSFHKYFTGNGKPKSFYVMDNNKKPVHYQRLLP